MNLMFLTHIHYFYISNSFLGRKGRKKIDIKVLKKIEDRKKYKVLNGKSFSSLKHLLVLLYSIGTKMKLLTKTFREEKYFGEEKIYLGKKIL